MAELRVFMADDHGVVREGLKALVNAQPGHGVVGEAGDGRAACRAWSSGSGPTWRSWTSRCRA